AREKSQPAQYQLLVKWVKVANRYFEEFAVPKMDEDTREKYQKFAKGFHPLMKKADEVTRNLMIPALADGQVGFVLDSKLTSKQWIDKLPETDKPLPIVEPALIVGVSDADKLRKGFAEYRKIGNDLLALIHSLDTEKIPELKIPRPKKSKGEKGDLYFYPLPEKWGLDKRIVPSAGISDKVLSLAISKEHAERLLADTPLKVKTGPLAKADKPLSAATYFNFARTIDTIAPWVEMATRKLAPRAMRLDPDDPATAGVVGGILD